MIYDDFQKRAFRHIENGHSVIVAAPTGAGKTVIAERVIENCLRDGKKVIYTSPIKALSNQKYRDFKDDYDEHVGILTGDVTINPGASTLIMTTEIFRNKILEERSDLADYSWVIFDEIHYLDDYERGSVWEESLIFLPDHMNILGLSATIPNIDEFVQWLRFVHKRPVKIVRKEKRPVPLHIRYQCQGRIYEDIESMTKEGFRGPDGLNHRGRRISHQTPLKPNSPLALIKHLAEAGELPCIYFVFSRRRTEQLAEELHAFDFLEPNEKAQVRNLFNELCQRFDLVGDAGAERVRGFVERGIAYHHAGMLPTLKEVVEQLFTSRLIKLIFTTETFALGINMPARSVIFDDLSKFYGFGHRLLKTRDFYQMAGRAGRRSIDKEGFVYCRVNPHYLSVHDVRRVVFGRTERISSQFNASYATLLNLYVKYKEKLYDIYPLSLHHFQEKKAGRRRAVDQLRDKVAFLTETGYIQNQELTPKGLFACKVYGYELLLSEFYACGLLEELSERDLGLLILAVVFEPRKGQPRPPLPKYLKDIERLTSDIYRAIHRGERRFHIRPFTKRPYFHLSEAMEHWLRGEAFSDILSFTPVDEGEVVRYFRMTIQVLRDIQQTEVSDALKDKIHRLLNTIKRDVIDSEKQLRS